MALGKLPAHLLRLRTQLQFAIVEKRRGRQCPRVVKALAKRYAVRWLTKDPQLNGIAAKAMLFC
jgi:hypothetical protein